jgi:hypothetical protein
MCHAADGTGDTPAGIVYEDTVFPLARDVMLMDRRESGALIFLAALSHNEVEQETEQ